MTDEMTEEAEKALEEFFNEMVDGLTGLVGEELARTRKKQQARFPGSVVPFELTPQEIGWLVTSAAAYAAVRARVASAADTAEATSRLRTEIRAIVAEELAKQAKGDQ